MWRFQSPTTLLWTSLVAQTVKHLPTMRETWVQSLGPEDLLENEMATHFDIRAWKIPWMEEPGGLQFMGSQRVGHNWATSLSQLTAMLGRLPSSEWQMTSLHGRLCFLLQSYPSTLDLSTPFNTIDYDLVWKCLREFAFLLVSILKRFYSYPSDSWHHVSIAALCSGAEVLEAGVQRGLILIWAHRLPVGPVTARYSSSVNWAV